MKILIINSVCGSGSTGRIVSDMWSILKDEGHTVKIAYGIGNATRVDSEDTFRINNRVGYLLHNAMSRVTDRAGFYSCIATWRLVDYIKQFQPDLIHLHNLHGYYINLSVLFQYLGKANIPIVWTLHDCWAFTGHCVHFDYIGCEEWKTGCQHCPAKRSYPQSLILDQSKRNYIEKKTLFTSVKNMTIVTPSQWLADLVRQSFLKKYHVIAIPNGIDLSVFKPTPSNFREIYKVQGKVIILGVANVWTETKGYNDMIQLAKYLDDSYQVVMVGLTKEQCAMIPANIIAIQRTSNIEELVQIYSAADVFVNPSYQETMGLVTAESIACGTPAVVYNRTAVPEIVDESCGIVVKAGDVVALAQSIREIAKSNRYKNIGLHKRSYDKNYAYQTYLQLYKSVAAR